MLYPLKFELILKPTIWGGNNICKFKNIEPYVDGIGESWEISDVSGDISIVSNGELKGKSLTKLIETYEAKLLGQPVMERFGTTFPLLIKFIDAQDDLSIQVHPNDELAMQRHHSFGKTEMWYVVDVKPGACLYSGFSRRITPEEYVQRVADNTITEVLQRYDVKAGDVFFLPAGRVHAIGKGCFIAEIQQTSNITYRIYDYDRKDANGNGRELHTELAKDAIDYTVYSDYKTQYTPPAMNEVIELVDCKYFTTNLISSDKPLTRDFSPLDSFVIYICAEGKAVLNDDKGNELPVKQGETVLIPAAASAITITPEKNSKFLETYHKFLKIQNFM